MDPASLPPTCLPLPPERRLWVIVCGSREWTDRLLFKITMLGLENRFSSYDGTGLQVVAGENPRGADAMAKEYAKRNLIPYHPFPAQWGDYTPETRWRAGHDRNQAMLDFILDQVGKPMVVALKDGLRPALDKGGTENMLRIAKEAGVPTMVVSHGPNPGDTPPALW